MIPIIDDYREPRYALQVSDNDMHDITYAALIESVMATQETELLPKIKVVLRNEDGELTDDLMWQEGNPMQLSMGTAVTGLNTIGNYVLRDPEFKFGGGNGRVLELKGEGEIAKLMMEGEKRRKWGDRTDSAIVEEIASYYGLKADVEDTEQVYPSIMQANQTDVDFIRERARLYGYQVYVDTGVLHFHPVRYEKSDLEFVYRQGDESNIEKFDVRIDTYRNGLTFKRTQVDPLTGDLVKEEGGDEMDSVTEGSDENNKLKYNDLIHNEERVKYLVNSGHLQNRQEVKRQVDMASQTKRWVVKANMRTFGVEDVRAGKTISVSGVGRFDGEYYVLRVRHEQNNGYKINADLARTTTGNVGRGKVYRARETGAGSEFDRTDDHKAVKTVDRT